MKLEFYRQIFKKYSNQFSQIFTKFCPARPEYFHMDGDTWRILSTDFRKILVSIFTNFHKILSNATGVFPYGRRDMTNFMDRFSKKYSNQFSPIFTKFCPVRPEYFHMDGETWRILSTDFQKNTRNNFHQFSQNSVQRHRSISIWTERHDEFYRQIFKKYSNQFSPIFTKFCPARPEYFHMDGETWRILSTDFRKILISIFINFHKNSVQCDRSFSICTERHEEAKSRFLQFCEHA